MGNRWRKAQKRTKIMACVVLGATVAALTGGIYLLSALRDYKNGVAAIQVQNIDLAAIGDGEYFGDCDTGLVGARVRVVVENHRITEIELLEHKNGRGEAAESLPDEIIREQRIDVDAVSGATSSSKVIQEAIIKALN